MMTEDVTVGGSETGGNASERPNAGQERRPIVFFTDDHEVCHHQLHAETARADAAEAELAETNRLLTAYQHDVVAWKRERDEALAKLDEIRDAVAEVLVDAGDHYQDNDDCIEGCPACALANVRKIVNPEATR